MWSFKVKRNLQFTLLRFVHLCSNFETWNDNLRNPRLTTWSNPIWPTPIQWPKLWVGIGLPIMYYSEHIEWNMAGLVVNYGHQWGTCRNEFGLCAQYMGTILSSMFLVQLGGPMWSLQEIENLDLNVFFFHFLLFVFLWFVLLVAYWLWSWNLKWQPTWFVLNQMKQFLIR